MLVDLHLSRTNGLSQARAWTTSFTDRDANHYVISLPPHVMIGGVMIGKDLTNQIEPLHFYERDLLNSAYCYAVVCSGIYPSKCGSFAFHL